MPSAMSNPFSLANTQPKIYDGSVVASMGGKRNMVTTIDFGTQNTFDIIISPRFDSPIYYSSNNLTQTAAGPPPVFAPDIEGKGDFADNHPFSRAWKAGSSGKQLVSEPGGEISRIRLISQGTRITLTNSTDDNDGWFEAFRFSPPKGSYVVGDAAPTPGEAYVPNGKPAPDLFGNRIVSAAGLWNMNLASKANYTTGKLRNLHRYTWMNKSNGKHDWIDLPNVIPTEIPNANMVAGDQSAASNLFQAWDFDCIWIRIHGRGVPANAAAGGCCLPTKLLVHVAQNVEAVFGEQNLLHSYMTKSIGLKKRSTSKRSTYKKKTASKRKTAPKKKYKKRS